ILSRHVLRNATRSLPLIITLNASEAILTLAGLGFLGFGILPTSAAEWGYDLNRAISDVASGIWWTGVFPGAALVLLVLGVTLVGESLNDLADPRLRIRRRAIGGACTDHRDAAERTSAPRTPGPGTPPSPVAPPPPTAGSGGSRSPPTPTRYGQWAGCTWPCGPGRCSPWWASPGPARRSPASPSSGCCQRPRPWPVRCCWTDGT